MTQDESPPLLAGGDLLPRIVVRPPGPASRRLHRRLHDHEAPGINTLVAGGGGPVWVEALGSNVLDADGNRFLDLTSGFGVAAIGHRHPRVVAAVERQASRLIHGLGDVHAHPARAELAARLCSLAPVDEPRVYFAVSGSDAVEVALKTAMLATGRPGIVAFEPAYHGVTLGSLAATAREAFRRPFAAHLHPHVQRLPFACEPRHLTELLAAGRSQVGGVVVEPIVGREGVLVPPPGWLSAVAEICRRRQVLLIADEIFTGFGRTGSGFAVDAEGVRPDLLCCGKALGGGLPIAAVLGRAELMACWETGGEALHTATFVAHPMACAAALATLAVLEEEALARRAAAVGQRLGSELERRLGGRRQVRQVRGRGLLWGVQLVSAAVAKAWSSAALERGVLALAGSPQGDVLQVVPSLTITEEQLGAALEILDEALSAAGAAGGAP